MKLGVTCLARTDMTPRPPNVVDKTPQAAAIKVVARGALDSLFDAEEEAPTTLYRPSKSASRSRARVAA